jgi:carbamate kinase
MRIVVALGGNALLERGAPMTASAQRRSIATACRSLAPAALEHELVISHGNGPQVGLLALQAAVQDDAAAFPLDVLDAQTEGMIGYVIEQELSNLLPPGRAVATLVTMVEVDPHDPAFSGPTKFVGPVYTRKRAGEVGHQHGWTMKRDGKQWRRVVPSPLPRRIVQQEPIEWLLQHGAVVICAGGGGIPCVRDADSGALSGIEAVIDKDRTSAVLAKQVDADTLIIATDVPGVFLDWGRREQRLIASASPDDLVERFFEAGSMGPKVAAAVEFSRRTGRSARIGAIEDLPALLAGHAGTRISPGATWMTFR